MSGDSIYRCIHCKKEYRLSEISKDMGDKSGFGFVWRTAVCPNCKASELDGEVWKRVYPEGWKPEPRPRSKLDEYIGGFTVEGE